MADGRRTDGARQVSQNQQTNCHRQLLGTRVAYVYVAKAVSCLVGRCSVAEAALSPSRAGKRLGRSGYDNC